MRNLGLPKIEAEQQFRRMIFNVISRNQDDHTKNISFLMDKAGHWRLSPAYDVTYSHNPAGQWTDQHQMSINGKRDNFIRGDFKVIGQSIGIKNVDAVINQIIDVVASWPVYAKNAGLSKDKTNKVSNGHRVSELA
jgi:serine/threonine-protein kinase HipA